MEADQGGMGLGGVFGSEVLGVDAGAAGAGEVEVEAVGEGDGEVGGDELEVGVEGVHLG